MTTIEKFDKNVMGSYGRYPVVLDSGHERTAVDENGRAYIDFGSGIGVNSLGFCNEKWTEAVCAQAKAIQHTSNYYYTKVQAEFAQRLCSETGYSKVFFGNSGAEANECAIKIARKYSFDKYGEAVGRNIIITLKNSFHGRTMATLSATGQDSFHNYFFPFLPGFVNVNANDVSDLKRTLEENKDRVCAVMFEFVQGEGGVIPLEQDFVNAVFEECEKNDILTVADEVQTGVGRTGRLLTSQIYNVKPDITTLAKGLAGGVPIGACLTAEKCSEVLVPGTHGSTFGGNPLACAGGNAVLETLITDGVLKDVTEKGEYFRKRLAEIDEIDGVDGLGLMLGIRLKTKKASDIAKACLKNGLLVLTAKEKLRFLPPLNITCKEIDAGIEILRKSL